MLADSWLAAQTGPYVMPGTYPSSNLYANPSGFSAPRPPQQAVAGLGVPYASGSARQQQQQAFAPQFDSGFFKQPIAPPQSAVGTPVSAHTPHSQLYGGAALDEPSHSGTRSLPSCSCLLPHRSPTCAF